MSKVACLFGFHDYQFRIRVCGRIHYIHYDCIYCGKEEPSYGPDGWRYRYITSQEGAEKYIAQCIKNKGDYEK